MDDATIKKLERELKTHARALGLPEGTAESFIKETLKSVKKSLRTKTIITEGDLTRLVARELKKYHSDFAYVYKNHDKII